MKARILPFVLGLVLFPSLKADANSIAIGLISFDAFIAGAPGSPGTNAFNITNFTGDPGLGGFALPPSFPVFSLLTFNNSTLTLAFSNGTSQVISLGSIGPGPLLDPNGNPLAPLQFPDTTVFSSAIFQGTLSLTNFVLSNGSPFVPLSNFFSVTLLPSSGSSLAAGTDFALIQVAPVPEPGTLFLMGSGLAGFWVLKRKKVAG